MTRPKLNRLFTVEGRTSKTTRRNIGWGFDRRRDYFDEIQEWGDYRLTMGDTAQSLIDLRPYDFTVSMIAVEESGDVQQDIPSLARVMGEADAGNWLRMAPPDLLAAGNFVHATLGDPTFRVYEDQLRREIDFFTLGDWTLTGPDFPWLPDTYIHLQLERHTAEYPADTGSTARRVWGELVERGAAVGVLDVTTQGLAPERAEESATALIRYDPALTLATGLVDDLGRRWGVSGVRTTEDRRYLELELSRTVSGLDA